MILQLRSSSITSNKWKRWQPKIRPECVTSIQQSGPSIPKWKTNEGLLYPNHYLYPLIINFIKYSKFILIMTLLFQAQRPPGQHRSNLLGQFWECSVESVEHCCKLRGLESMRCALQRSSSAAKAWKEFILGIRKDLSFSDTFRTDTEV